MKLLASLSLLTVIGIVLGVSAVQAAEVNTNAITAESIVRDLNYRDAKKQHLLAFMAQADNRPLYAESALLAIELTNEKWRLVHVYRHPKEHVEHFRHWKVAAMTDVPYTGSRDLERRPTKAEVEKFIRDTRWVFGPSNSFRLVRGVVYSEEWQRALGHEPKYEFPKPTS
jgi:hypothetical protein